MADSKKVSKIHVDGIPEKIVNKYEDEAKEILQDADKFERFLERLERKLKKFPVVGTMLADVPMMVSLVRSYVRKEYTKVPLGTVLAVTIALLYFLSPIDLIPDAVPGIGHLDDGAVVLGTLNMVHDDISEYVSWREKNGKRLSENA